MRQPLASLLVVLAVLPGVAAAADKPPLHVYVAIPSKTVSNWYRDPNLATKIAGALATSLSSIEPFNAWTLKPGTAVSKPRLQVVIADAGSEILFQTTVVADHKRASVTGIEMEQRQSRKFEEPWTDPDGSAPALPDAKTADAEIAAAIVRCLILEEKDDILLAGLRLVPLTGYPPKWNNGVPSHFVLPLPKKSYPMLVGSQFLIQAGWDDDHDTNTEPKQVEVLAKGDRSEGRYSDELPGMIAVSRKVIYADEEKDVSEWPRRELEAMKLHEVFLRYATQANASKVD